MVAQLFIYGCPTDLPDNMHISVNLLSRLTKFSKPKCVKLITGIGSLGFYSRLKKYKHDPRDISEDEFVVVEWHDMTTDPAANGNATDIANAMLVGDHVHCTECAAMVLRRLDFSHLSSESLGLMVKRAGAKQAKRRRKQSGADIR